MRKFLIAVGLLALSAPAFSATVPCDTGKAGAYDCNRVDMLSHMTQADLGGTALGNLNDMWGWVDDMGTPSDTSDDQVYALVGRELAAVFVNITDPQNPVYIGNLPDYSEEIGGCPSSPKSQQAKHEESSPWRDIKTYSHYAFIVSETACEGIQVFDLQNLRGLDGSSPMTFTEDAHYTKFGHAHNLFIDQRGYAYAVGTDTYAGGPHIVDVTNPLNPVKLGGYSGDGYTHDIQCVDYSGPDSGYSGKEICFASNEDTLTILDATDPANVQQLARVGYDHVGYAHQGWLTANQHYFYFDDELDEQNTGAPTRTLIWDVSDLTAPKVAHTYLAQTRSIDHNQYLNGRFDYQANYTSGLHILDTHSLTRPFEVGSFDTYPDSEAATFHGAWSAYPFFPNGVVGVSDIENGLFLLKPTFASGFPATADLGISVAADGGTKAAYIAFPYTITVTNNGPDAAGDVQVSMILAQGLHFQGTASVDGAGSCSLNSSTQLKCNVGTLSSGGSRTITIQAYSEVISSGVGATAMVSGDVQDDKGANNTALLSVAVKSQDQGSGGGSFGWLALASIALLGLIRRR